MQPASKQLQFKDEENKETGSESARNARGESKSLQRGRSKKSHKNNK